MKKFVLDNSVIMSWCFEDENGERSRKMLERLSTGSALVPALWPFELSNVLLMAERHKRLSSQDSETFLHYLSRLLIEVDQAPVRDTIEGCRRLAHKCHVTAYDAAYLYLAERERLPLATFDGGMIKAARKLNIEII